MKITSNNTFTNPRLMAALLLGFSSGLPLALTSSTLQAWFTSANVNLAAIGSLTLIGIPYTLKFLWSPFLDYYQIPRLGLRKGWILVMQLAVALSLLLLANMNPETQAASIMLLALITALLSATQDVAVDAYRTDILTDSERGLGAAYYVFTYRLAVVASGGFALVFADFYGWKLTYEIMALLMILVMVLTLNAPAIQHELDNEKNVWQTMMVALSDLMRHENIIILLLFVMFYKLGDALALSLMTNFLLKGLGFSLTEVGLAYKIVSFAATVLGAFAGGAILTRRNIYFGLMVFGLAQAFSNLMFVLLAVVGKNFSLMAVSIFIENFCSGLSTAAFLAFLMSVCNKKYTATQYALLSAIASLARVFLGPVAAMMVGALGWAQFFMWSFVLSLPGILLLLMLKEKVLTYAHAAEHS
ncbi:MAG TPA: MFS transporter [Gammaproteobacteria bacterium]|jgi:PAT family beta-lactamase induction signal transducer AmpG|nr:MFS transporter [Gammaproteobacteria bacterium]